MKITITTTQFIGGPKDGAVLAHSRNLPDVVWLGPEPGQVFTLDGEFSAFYYLLPRYRQQSPTRYFFEGYGHVKKDHS